METDIFGVGDINTIGKNAKKIEEYIRNQLQEDYTADQITLKEYIDPFTGEPSKERQTKNRLSGSRRKICGWQTFQCAYKHSQ